MEIKRALQQLELLQKKLYAYHCADSSLYLDAVTTAPSDTSEGRGVAMSILAGESQKLMTCPTKSCATGRTMSGTRPRHRTISPCSAPSCRSL